MKVNFGCGPFPLDGWLNVDYQNWHRADGTGFAVDLSIDLNGPWPPEIQDVEFAYCGHLLSPGFDDGGAEFLKKVRAVMRPGGILRICDFDADWLMSKFFDQPRCPDNINWAAEWRNRRDWGHEVDKFRTPLEMFNADVRRWGRRYLLNYDTAAILVRDAGFSTVQRVGAGQSLSAELRGIEPRIGIVQFCLEATA